MRRPAFRGALLALVLVSVAPEARAGNPWTPLEWQPKLENSPRDTNHNYVDDVLESQSGSVTVVVALNRCPEPADLARLGGFGTVAYVAEWLTVVELRNVPVSRLTSLASDKVVSFVEADNQLFHTLDISSGAIRVKSSPYSPDTVRDKYAAIRGAGVNVAIVDSGVDDQDGMGSTHQAFPPGKFLFGARCTNTETSCTDTNPGPPPSPFNPDDAEGTGTHLAGIAIGAGEGGMAPPHEGIAPDAGLIDVQVSSPPFLRLVPVVRAVDRILRRDWDPQVVLLPFTDCRPSDGTLTLSNLANRMADEDLVVVTGAGNCSACLNRGCASCPCPLVAAPAAADRVITVANSSDAGSFSRIDDTLSVDSLRGPRVDDGDSDTGDEQKPDLAAPGTAISSALFDTAAFYVDRSGTSAAAAHVAGCAALLRSQDRYITPDLLKALLLDTSEDRDAFGWDPQWGRGLLDCFAAIDRRNSELPSDLRFNGGCGFPGGPECWEHPALYTSNPRIREGIANTIVAEVFNAGPAISGPYSVKISVHNFSNDDDKYYICEVQMPELGIQEVAQATCPWTTSISGGAPGVVHACLVADIHYLDDKNLGNNRVQHNVNIEQAFSPARMPMEVVNTSEQDVTIEIQGTFACTGAGAPDCPGWTLGTSDNLFPLGRSDCPRVVMLNMTPAAPDVQREARARFKVLGHTQSGGIVPMGGVSMIAQLAWPTGDVTFASDSQFTWSQAPCSQCPALFDVARGLLPIRAFNSRTLRGDFSASACLANDTPSIQFTDGATPPRGMGFYYVTRTGGPQPGSWDCEDSAQAGSRDDTLTSCQ